MATPLSDALMAYSAAEPLRFHMPGHKGTLSPLDVTELPPTGNLYEAGGPIEQAQALWAQALGMPHCLFLTNGSTAGVFTALAAAAQEGDEILLDRDCHLSFHHAMAALDLHPQFLRRSLGEPLRAGDVEQAMAQSPRARVVCLTSPSYYGVLCDIPAIAALVHARGGILLVDGAHGAHLPFLLGQEVFAGADLLVLSAHKTLPALGQSALLGASERFPLPLLRQKARIFQSSSPSYLLMASLDRAREEMQGAYLAQYRRVAAWNRWSLGDPTRAVMHTDGLRWAQELMDGGIYPELWNRDNVVFILTGSDTPQALTRLEAEILRAPAPLPPLHLPVPQPARACSPRRAVFSPSQSLPLQAAQGRIAAAPIAPYPPGIAVVAPGEIIDKKTIAYLEKIMYNSVVEVVV